MPIDLRTLQFIVRGPWRFGDGSFQFKLIVLNPSPILGQPATMVATADVQVDSDKVCFALAEALKMVAEKLPPELALPNGAQP